MMIRPWPYRGYPPLVLLGGYLYRRSMWRFPRPGVVAQYRQCVPEHSRHVLVTAAGWHVSHKDAVNPEYGVVAACRHLLADVLRFGADSA